MSLVSSCQYCSELSLARSTYLTSEVITGRGVAEPPRLNIRTFQRNDEEYDAAADGDAAADDMPPLEGDVEDV